ncbi:MAG: hypothetical protein ISS56_20325 [Anaerolineae bacterium]|nr:hypothetical protein [Anaerolineae bacterium]
MQRKSELTDQVCLRHRLGIPDDAGQVLLFAESSHWDPNWLLTSEAYYGRFVERNLDLAIAELQRDPRRVYSVECVFFLRMYWERRPESRQEIRELANEGRLRLTSSGVTTADTLLPRTEAILRDWLIGQEWLRAQGIAQEPTLAYFADSFGFSPALPSLLTAAGFDRTAITRVDGMYFVGADYEPRSRFPRRDSSAALLLEKERTLDFWWRDMNGAEVLCHWNAYTYGQGDMLAYRGLNRIYLFPFAVPDRSDRLVSRRIEQYVAQLAPYSRTPYMFCPIGFDFVGPIPSLLDLLDRYNRIHYPSTGVWALNAGLDDYLALVEGHGDRLPVVQLDPNPYWTGFYTARPTLKRRYYELVELLLRGEQTAALQLDGDASRTAVHALDEAWWDAVVANHHDYITGTSPDSVVEQEQLPWLDRAIAATGQVIEGLAPPGQGTAPPTVATEGKESPQWVRRSGGLEIRTSLYTAELAEDAGGSISRMWDPDTDEVWLAGVSNSLVSYRDSGGLWRMGHEFRGGTFAETAQAAGSPGGLQVHECSEGLEVECITDLDGERIHRRLWFAVDSPVVRFQIEGRAAQGRTVTIRFQTGLSPNRLTMDQPGGVVTRPLSRIYDPTFWPVQHFLHLQDRSTGRGIALCLDMPGAICCRPDGTLEIVALRNATRERAFGFLPLLANPASGHERETHTLGYALVFTAGGGWQENDIPAIARQVAASTRNGAGTARRRVVAPPIVTTGGPGVVVAAVKPASRGEGTIIRLCAPSPPASTVTVSIPGRTIVRATLCDARERDVEPLQVHEGAAHIGMAGTIATVRLLTAPRSLAQQDTGENS